MEYSTFFIIDNCYLHVLFTLFVFVCVYWCPIRVEFLFCPSSSCVPNVTNFTGLSIFDCPFVFSNIYLFKLVSIGTYCNIVIKSFNRKNRRYIIKYAQRVSGITFIWYAHWNGKPHCLRGRRGCDRMAVGFITTYAISAYHY